MNFNIPTLEKWAVFNDVLIGRTLNHPDFENGKRIRTNKCIKLDKKIGMALCVGNESWQLGEPGHLGMYVDPITKRFF